MRLEQRLHRFCQTRDVLRDIDERDGEVARAVENRETQRADQHDMAGGSPSLRPQPQRPAEQPSRQNRSHDRVEQPQFLEIQQALLTRDHFGLDRRAEALLLAKRHTERTHERHVADHIDQFAID